MIARHSGRSPRALDQGAQQAVALGIRRCGVIGHQPRIPRRRHRVEGGRLDAGAARRVPRPVLSTPVTASVLGDGFRQGAAAPLPR